MNFDGAILIGQPKNQKQVEVCRSFAYKLNLANYGGNSYESADFFCSRKITCSEDDVPAISEAIFEECVQEVRSAVAATIAETKRKRQADQERRSKEQAA